MGYIDLGDERVDLLLENAKTIAIVGLSDNPEKTSYKVAKVVQDAGYKIIPVNPMKEGMEILGEKVHGSLENLDAQVDIVNVFRPSDALLGVAKEFIVQGAPVFWSQLGLENDEAADLLYENGYKDVVMNRCLKLELKRIEEARA